MGTLDTQRDWYEIHFQSERVFKPLKEQLSADLRWRIRRRGKGKNISAEQASSIVFCNLTPKLTSQVTPAPVSNESMSFISSSNRAKSKMSEFALILSGFDDFGIQMNPDCKDQRMRIWAGVLHNGLKRKQNGYRISREPKNSTTFCLFPSSKLTFAISWSSGRSVWAPFPKGE